MFDLKKILTPGRSTGQEVDAVQMKRVLKISNNLLKSQYLFNREEV